MVEINKVIPGKLWTELFDILRIKAREGVNVKLIYDDAISTKFISKVDFLKKDPVILLIWLFLHILIIFSTSKEDN